MLCGAARCVFLCRIWRYAHAASLCRAPGSACAAKKSARQRCGLRSGLLCCHFTRDCLGAGAAGWLSHHGVGEAHGRGWCAVCRGRKRGPGADGVQVQGTLGGTGQAGRGPLAGDAAAGEVRRAQADTGARGQGQGAGRPEPELGSSEGHRHSLAAGRCHPECVSLLPCFAEC